VVTIQTALEVAVKHHNTGEHQTAEQIYRAIIEQQPAHPDALHLLGERLRAFRSLRARSRC
jgi:hypothetical protein